MSQIVAPVSDVVSALTDVWEFAYEESGTGRLIEVNRTFGDRIREQLVGGIRMMVEVMAQIGEELGAFAVDAASGQQLFTAASEDALTQASIVAEKVGPVADAIGSILEPISALLANPLVDTKGGSGFAVRARRTCLANDARLMSEGIKRMAKVLIDGLQGIKVPSNLGDPLLRLVSAVMGDGKAPRKTFSDARPLIDGTCRRGSVFGQRKFEWQLYGRVNDAVVAAAHFERT